MKTKLLLSFLLLSSFAFGQIVNIPDSYFKTRLIDSNPSVAIAKNLEGDNFKIDANNDGEIQETEALQVSYLNVAGSYSIQSLIGIQSFQNLITLYCYGNLLTTIDLSGMFNLQELYCYNNQLTTLNASNLLNLQTLECGSNQMTTLDVSGLENLQILNCIDNQLTILEVSDLTNLQTLECSHNYLNNLTLSGLVNLQTLSCIGNQLTNLEVLGLTNLQYFFCEMNQLTNLDVTGLSNLIDFDCSGNELTTLDVSSLVNLRGLNCSANLLTSLDVSGLTNLELVYCRMNQLTALDVSAASNLKYIKCSHNQLTALDFSDLSDLVELDCSYNQLFFLNIKNGSLVDTSYSIFGFNPNLQYICADEDQISNIQTIINQFGNTINCHVNSYCSFKPGGPTYTIQGVITFDNENNGCDLDDLYIPSILFNINDGTSYGGYISNSSGNYNLYVQEGTLNITPIFENPSFFNISPNNFTVSFPADTNPFTQNLCITPNGIHNDLEVTILPINAARPGFEAQYKILYNNKGNTQLSGIINFAFDDEKIDFVSASVNQDDQSMGNLIWNFTDLLPFETREILLTLHINSPTEMPAVNIGDLLNFNATINPISGDELPNDNVFALQQTVVGSFDPNDKTCLEGTTIPLEKNGDYLHYLIRFENTGTYPAENIVVKDLIDINVFDFNTLQISETSHSCVTRITNPNQVEFIFENINLPFDDAANDGFVAFKIKTKPTITEGTLLLNKADIFFDYNFPITTNEYVTSVQTLDVQDINDVAILLYPNPVEDILTFNSKEEIIKIEIYDVVGRIIQIQSVSEHKVDLSALKSGNYLIKFFTIDYKTASFKIAKE